MFLRMGDNLGPRGCQGLQGPLLQIDMAEIVIPKTDQPNAVIGVLDAKSLASKDAWDFDFLLVKVDPSAGGDDNVAVMERIARARQPARRVRMQEV